MFGVFIYSFITLVERLPRKEATCEGYETLYQISAETFLNVALMAEEFQKRLNFTDTEASMNILIKLEEEETMMKKRAKGSNPIFSDKWRVHLTS